MCEGIVLLGCTQETRRSYLELEPKLDPTRVRWIKKCAHNTTETDSEQ